MPRSSRVTEKVGQHKRGALPGGQQGIEIQSHEAAGTGNNDAVGLSVGVDQPRCRIGAQGVEIALFFVILFFVATGLWVVGRVLWRNQ